MRGAAARRAAGAVFLAVLAGCRSPAGAPEGPAACAGSDPAPVPGYPAYRYAEVRFVSGAVHAANWAWRHPRRVTVNVDVASFAPAVGEKQLLDAVDRAIAFWDGMVELSLGDTGPCCGADAGEVDVVYAETPDELGVPAYTRYGYGDDPGTDEVELGCLVGGTVGFYAGGLGPGGAPVAYRWVDEGRDVRDLDPTDGDLDKPIHDTLVHELGHAVGLGDQADDSVACSVMANCADPACGCNYDEVGAIDAAALRTLYGG